MGLVQRISLVGRHKRAHSGGGVGVVPSLPGPSGGGSLIAAAVVEQELLRPRWHIPCCSFRIRRVSCHCGFLKRRHRTVNISIGNHLTIRICILRRKGSFLLLRVVARQVPCSLRQRCLEALYLSPNRIRGAWVWCWEVCGRHHLRRLGSTPSCGRGSWRTSDGNSKEGRLARVRLHVNLHSVTAKTDRQSVDFEFDSEDTNHQQVSLPPIEI